MVLHEGRIYYEGYGSRAESLAGSLSAGISLHDAPAVVGLFHERNSRPIFLSLLMMLLMSGLWATPAAAQVAAGVRGGVSIEADQVFVGGHVETEPLIDRLRFRPNVEVGFGDGLTMTAFNFEFVYAFPSRSPGTCMPGRAVCEFPRAGGRQQLPTAGSICSSALRTAPAFSSEGKDRRGKRRGRGSSPSATRSADRRIVSLVQSRNAYARHQPDDAPSHAVEMMPNH
jgi:hypothetical protein